jgi:diguanylate cyclase (GGDEF)-like protein
MKNYVFLKLAVLALAAVALFFLGSYIGGLIPDTLLPSSAAYRPEVLYFFAACAAVLLTAFFIITVLGRRYSTKELREDIYRLAYVDKLTGFRNFERFREDAAEILADSPNAAYSIISIDIDHFKTVNEINGYAYGDSLLCDLANSINAHLNKDELFCRFYEDKFALLIKKDKLIYIKKRINAILEEACAGYVNGEIKPFTFSCGIYHLESGDCAKLKTAHSYAQTARCSLPEYHETLCDFAVFDETMRQRLFDKNYFESELHKSIIADDFVLYFQPKYSIQNAVHTLSGAEALVRWIHHDKGFLPPGEFIPVFEETGQIVELDLYIFEKLCRQLRQWLDSGIAPLPVSFNLSRVTLLNSPTLDNILIATAAKYDVNPSLITIEITETVDCNVTYFSTLLDNLKQSGFGISMDDFGSGYSSFDLLHRLPIDSIKLDKKFFDFWTEKNKEKAKIIIKAAVNLSKDLNMISIAEGAELEEQISFLKSINCDMVQSYYFSKPVPVLQFETLLEG